MPRKPAEGKEKKVKKTEKPSRKQPHRNSKEEPEYIAEKVTPVMPLKRKAPKTKKGSNKYPSYRNMVLDALKGDTTSHSMAEILKIVKGKFVIEAPPKSSVELAVKKLVSDEQMIKTGDSYRVDPSAKKSADSDKSDEGKAPAPKKKGRKAKEAEVGERKRTALPKAEASELDSSSQLVEFTDISVMVDTLRELELVLPCILEQFSSISPQKF
jgi:hypothetical protein